MKSLIFSTIMLEVASKITIRYIGGLFGANYILNRHFVSENAWRRPNCEVAEYIRTYTFSVQTNLFSRIIGGLVRLADYRGDTVYIIYIHTYIHLIDTHIYIYTYIP